MQSFFRWVLGLAVLLVAGIAVARLMDWPIPIQVDLPTIQLDYGPGTWNQTPIGGPGPAAMPAATIMPTEAPAAAPTPGGSEPQAAAPTVAPAEPPTPTIPPVTPGAIVKYKIKSGDNLTVIAEQYNTTVAAIQARNHIDNPSLIFVGFVIEIVPGEGMVAQAPAPTAPAPRNPATGGSEPPPAAPTQPPPPPAPPANSVAPASPDALEPTRPAKPASAYEVYIPTATKQGQYFHYTCEFDAAWAVLKTYGFDVNLDEGLQLVGVDTSVEPTYKETPLGVEIYGGDIANFYSGDYKKNFLARATGSAMRKLFEHYGLRVTPVHDQAGVETALRAGELIWIKTTVDFKRWVPATWIGPDGTHYETVLGNDHAVVVAGFNADSVLIRDVLGPTSTNAHRLFEYEVSWPTFLAAWGAQSYDGLAVAPPAGH